METASAADLIQRRQRSEFLCELSKTFFFNANITGVATQDSPFVFPFLTANIKGTLSTALKVSTDVMQLSLIVKAIHPFIYTPFTTLIWCLYPQFVSGKSRSHPICTNFGTE